MPADTHCILSALTANLQFVHERAEVFEIHGFQIISTKRNFKDLGMTFTSKIESTAL